MPNKDITQFGFPRTEIVFGPGSHELLPQKLSGLKKVLVVSDRGLESVGLAGKVLKVLKNSRISYETFFDVHENPRSEEVVEGARVVAENGCEGIVALGGGSVIDCAKAIAIIATSGAAIADYEGVEKVRKELLPIVALPTTAGTGSEISRHAVITDSATGRKVSIRSTMLFPKVAILDPTLLITLPASIAAGTGMDALAHNMEYYLALSATPLSEGISLQAIHIISQNLRPFVGNRANVDAAGKMLLASMMGQLTFAPLARGLGQQMAKSIGSLCDLPHGIVSGITLVIGMEYNLIACPEKLREIAIAMGERVEGLSLHEAAKRAIEATRQLAEDIGIPKSLGALGVKEEQIEALALDTMKGDQLKVNPRTITFEQVRELYRRAL